MMTVTSGRRILELYGNSARCGSLVKTCLESSIWHSTRSVLRWKAQVTKSNRLLFRLAASTRRTGAKECLLWPTPSTGAALCGGTGNLQQLRKLALAGILNAEELRNLSSGNGGKTNPALLEWLMGYEQKFTELIPTPRACDYKGASAKRFFGGGVLQSTTVRTDRMHSAWDCWPPEPGIPRVVDGLPDRVDRIKSLGNAVVPQQAYPIFRAIMEVLS